MTAVYLIIQFIATGNCPDAMRAPPAHGQQQTGEFHGQRNNIDSSITVTDPPRRVNRVNLPKRSKATFAKSPLRKDLALWSSLALF